MSDEKSIDDWLITHAQAGSAENCHEALFQGANIAHKDATGLTALHWSVMNSHPNACVLLLDRGADIEAKDDEGWTALHWAVWGEDAELCRILIERGADIESEDNENNTVIYRAVKNGRYSICAFLIEHGALFGVKNKEGKTPLATGVFQGNDQTCLTLIAYGADSSDGPDEMRHLTPIEAAARGGFIPRLMTLLEESTADHQALADLALEHGQEEAAAAIRSHVACAQIKSIAKGAAPCLS